MADSNPDSNLIARLTVDYDFNQNLGQYLTIINWRINDLIDLFKLYYQKFNNEFFKYEICNLNLNPIHHDETNEIPVMGWQNWFKSNYNLIIFDNDRAFDLISNA